MYRTVCSPQQFLSEKMSQLSDRLAAFPLAPSRMEEASKAPAEKNVVEGDGSERNTEGVPPNATDEDLAIPLSAPIMAEDGEEGDWSEVNTVGVPPNATDEDGNIIVAEFDILCGRGGHTNNVSLCEDPDIFAGMRSLSGSRFG
jgi:hypothetical protein